MFIKIGQTKPDSAQRSKEHKSPIPEPSICPQLSPTIEIPNLIETLAASAYDQKLLTNLVLKRTALNAGARQGSRISDR